MRLAYLLAAGSFAVMFAAPAFAGDDADVQNACEEYAAANNGDASGCECLAELANGDADLTAQILAIQSPDDLDNASDSVKEAVGTCWPEEGDDGAGE